MKWIVCVLFVGISVTEGCLDGWVQHNDMCYFLSHDKATWYEALAVCTSIFGTLAEPDTPDVQQFLVSLVPRNTTHPSNYFQYWIGVSDIFRENHWIFMSTQQNVKTTFWYPGEPNNKVGTSLNNSDEDCVVFNWDGKGAWNDFSCTTRYLFACQKEDTDINIVG